jgi:hypothetical protein
VGRRDGTHGSQAARSPKETKALAEELERTRAMIVMCGVDKEDEIAA